MIKLILFMQNQFSILIKIEEMIEDLDIDL